MLSSGTEQRIDDLADVNLRFYPLRCSALVDIFTLSVFPKKQRVMTGVGIKLATLQLLFAYTSAQHLVSLA